LEFVKKKIHDQAAEQSRQDAADRLLQGRPVRLLKISF
jgi:hypothetical protein